MRASTLAIAVLLVSASCVDVDGPFRCTSSKQCVSKGVQGICEPQGYCSFPDESCADGGQRFAPLSGDLGGVCVEAPTNPSLCSEGSFALCDGFEAPALSASWMPDITNAVIEPDTAHAYRGMRSLHVHKDATNGGPSTYDYIYASPTLTATQYFRAFFYVPSPGPAGFTNLMNSDATTTAGGVDFVAQSGAKGLSVGLNDWFSDSGSGDHITPTLLTKDDWVCVEIQVTPATGAGTFDLKLAINGVVQSAASFAAATIPSVARRLYLGYGTNMPPAMPAVDFWVDEVAVDSAPIGCQR
jgi:hypothetical protein